MELNLMLNVHRYKQVSFNELQIGAYFVGVDFPTDPEPVDMHTICIKVSDTKAMLILFGGSVYKYRGDRKIQDLYYATLDRNYDAGGDVIKAFNLELENLKLKAEIEDLKAQLAGLPQPHPQDAVLGGF